MKKMTVLFISLSLFISLAGCATAPVTPVAVREYKPVNAEEAAVISVIIAFEESFNQADAKKMSSILADEAKMMHGWNKQILTKEEYKKILPQRIKEMGVVTFSNPRIEINQGEATVWADYKSRVAVLNYSFKLKKMGDKWLIMSNSF
ncbi:MAG: nuclear transport factor 2 family protein [Desulfobacteraceae bacterium]|nr:MAG: nuclear transport factor 2 family protein [Desulfobacteraceae bacterium]